MGWMKTIQNEDRYNCAQPIYTTQIELTELLLLTLSLANPNTIACATVYPQFTITRFADR